MFFYFEKHLFKLRKIAYFYQSLIALFAMLFVDAVLSSSQLINLTELFFSRVLLCPFTIFSTKFLFFCMKSPLIEHLSDFFSCSSSKFFSFSPYHSSPYFSNSFFSFPLKQLSKTLFQMFSTLLLAN